MVCMSVSYKTLYLVLMIVVEQVSSSYNLLKSIWIEVMYMYDPL